MNTSRCFRADRFSDYLVDEIAKNKNFISIFVFLSFLNILQYEFTKSNFKTKIAH